MSVLHSRASLRIIGLLALVLFAGDMMADSVGELCSSPCPVESPESAPPSDKAPCHCTCATHIGAVIVTDFAMSLERDVHPTSFLLCEDEGTPPRLAASIDHPPQLS